MRIKRGKIAHKRRKGILKRAKGFRLGRKNKIKLAKEATTKAGQKAYIGRKQKKRNFRRLWQIKINAGARLHEITYSRFMNGLKKAKVGLDRKILAELAENNPKVFEKIVETAKKALKNGK